MFKQLPEPELMPILKSPDQQQPDNHQDVNNLYPKDAVEASTDALDASASKKTANSSTQTSFSVVLMSVAKLPSLSLKQEVPDVLLWVVSLDYLISYKWFLVKNINI